MQLYPSHFLLVLATASIACSDDDNAATGESSGGGDSSAAASSSGPGDTGGVDSSSTGSAPVDVDMLAACPEDDLMVQEFMGPAFDPETGELVAPLPVPHVVATTVGWPEVENWEALQGYTNNVVGDVFQREGLLGASFGMSAACGSARTITLWADEASMMQFVVGDAHVDAIQNALSLTKAWETTHWSETADDQPPSWDRAREQLDEVRAD
jgi:hypothetical protein